MWSEPSFDRQVLSFLLKYASSEIEISQCSDHLLCSQNDPETVRLLQDTPGNFLGWEHLPFGLISSLSRTPESIYSFVAVVQLLNRVCLFVTPCSVARHAPLSLGVPRQEYWRGLPFPSPKWVLSSQMQCHVFTLMQRWSYISHFSPFIFSSVEHFGFPINHCKN